MLVFKFENSFEIVLNDIPTTDGQFIYARFVKLNDWSMNISTYDNSTVFTGYKNCDINNELQFQIQYVYNAEQNLANLKNGITKSINKEFIENFNNKHKFYNTKSINMDFLETVSK